MPSPVRTYIPSSRPIGSQLKPRSHSRAAAATRPASGATTATRLTTRAHVESPPRGPAVRRADGGDGGPRRPPSRPMQLVEQALQDGLPALDVFAVVRGLRPVLLDEGVSEGLFQATQQLCPLFLVQAEGKLRGSDPGR